MVAAAHNAGLLYLQHIVALHAPIRAGRLTVEPDTPSTETSTRAQHPARVRGLGAAHRRIHSDVLVFTSHTTPPHRTPPPAAGEAVCPTRVLR